MRLDPAQCGIPEQGRHAATAIRFPHRKQAQFVKTVIHRKWQIATAKILIDRVAAAFRRSQTDETRNLIAASDDEIDVMCIEIVAELFLIIDRMLPDLPRKNLVTKKIDFLPVRCRCEAQFKTESASRAVCFFHD